MNAFVASLIIVLTSPSAFAANRCDEVLQNADVLANIASLARLKLSLENNKFTGTASISQKALEQDYKDKEKNLRQYLRQNKIMNDIQFKLRLKQQIEYNQQNLEFKTEQDEKQKERDQQDRKLTEETQKFAVDGMHAVFHSIEHGTFKSRPHGKGEIVLSDFDMMATKTTQIIWRKVAELANKYFPDKYSINPDPSYFKGDTRPVEHASYNQIQIWFDALNDLSQAGALELNDIIADHQHGDFYRFPTEAEWEFVATGRGKLTGDYYFGDESLADQFEWHQGNSDNETHPVAKKHPLLIDDKDFYDMLGNTAEWVLDWQKNDTFIPFTGQDPTGDKSGNMRVYRGGGYNSVVWRTKSRHGYYPDREMRGIGFRIVRKRLRVGP